MSPTTIDTPAAALQALNDDGAILPPKSRCDVFSRADAKVQCMVCNSPAMRRSAPQVVIILMGASRYEQREAAAALQRLIGDSQVMPGGLHLLQTGGVTLILAPWLARDDVRAVLASVSSSLHPDRVTVDGSQLESDAAVVVPGPGSQGDVALEIRRQLSHFVADANSIWRSARRLISSKEEHKVWEFPLGCRVVERIEGRRACWEIGFEEFHKLERAAELVEARLDMRRDNLLQRTPADASESEDDLGETRMPAITLMATDNSREARAQMARLLQNILFLVGRLGFVTSMSGELDGAQASTGAPPMATRAAHATTSASTG